MFLGRLVLITLEHVTEARRNPTLRRRMVKVVQVFHAELDAIWREFFSTSGMSEREVETTLNMTLCLFRGMGLQTVLKDDAAYYHRLRDAWKVQLAMLLDVKRNPTTRRKRRALQERNT